MSAFKRGVSTPLIRMIVRRLLLAVPLVFIVSVITFVLAALTPGDPGATILGPYASRAQDAALDRVLGFNLPVWTQYWHWVEHALHGNLGVSLISSEPVVSELNQRIGVTLSLVVGATLVSAIGGVVLGTLSATRGGAVGRLTDAFSMLGFAIPNFWLGLVLVELFAIDRRWLPATGYISLDQSPSGWLKSITLPVLTLAAGGVTAVTKQTRDAMSDALSRGWVDALRADGVSERRIVFVHALRAAAIPIVTQLGTIFVGLLGGTVLVESVFALPGLGGAAVSATSAHDLPMIQGIALYFCLAVVVINLIVDLAYGWLNPRARVL